MVDNEAMPRTKTVFPLINGTNELGLGHWVDGGWPLVMLLCDFFVSTGCYSSSTNDRFGSDLELSRPSGRHEAMPRTKTVLPLINGTNKLGLGH